MKQLEDIGLSTLWTLRKKKEIFDVATGMIYGVASFSSWSKSICDSKTNIMRIRGPRRQMPPFEGENHQ